MAGHYRLTPFTLLSEGHETAVDATFSDYGVRMTASDVEVVLGWELKPEGLCKDDVCIPLAARSDLVAEGMFNLTALADLIGRPLAVSTSEHSAYLGPPFVLHEETVGHLEAPDFTFPDLDGRMHSLSEHRGSKVLLAAWASW